jgi:alkanesulfonate monooxygenase SsuD/methylene tetrahydromethanopterin reductase-like flavin-dependent oxidoreductase (luciferase family)
LIGQLVEEVQEAERGGFSFCLIPEHHQAPDPCITAPLTFAAALLSQTKSIVVGTGVLLAGVHHPVHLAEQMTMLDHLSDGRFVLGVGTGYQAADFDPFGVALDSRATLLEEVLVAVSALLESSVASFDGDHFSFKDVKLRPRPKSSPRPPIWVGSWSKKGVDRTARLADGWIADPIRSDGEIAALAVEYRAACGRHRRPGTVTVMREAWIDSDNERAVHRFAPVIEPIYRYYLRRGAYRGTHADDSVPFADVADRVLCGDAATVARRIRETAASTGADRVALHLRHPQGPSHEDVVAGIVALGAALRS